MERGQSGGPDDGFLHVWECPWVLENYTHQRCGYLQNGPGFCPYDHRERVALIEITATVHCSDCSAPIMRDDCRTPDQRLVCDSCVMGYIGQTEGAG